MPHTLSCAEGVRNGLRVCYPIFKTMWSSLKGSFVAGQHFFSKTRERIGMWMQTRTYRDVVIFCACIFVIGVVLPSVVHADALNGLEQTIFGALNKLMSWIVQAIGAILLFLIEIFIGFVSYNGFGNAAPVQTGWVLVRDICNMFFIVILLVSAFSTIIGYGHDSFHYSRVLPKLLLMAILINFSKTFISLLIDVSQVVMISFVNAFRDAAAGNFTSAFGITDYLNFQQQASGDQAVEYAKIFGSYILAMVLFIIACGVMLVMIIYVIARIVGLWMALIFSPLALFATALPGRLKQGMGAFTGKYWSRLGGMLSGGPIIAFFVWLTLATVQASAVSSSRPGQPSSNGSLASTVGLTIAGQDQGTATRVSNAFVTEVANTDHLATFIVAVAMMLMGLEAAVAAASEVNSYAGSLAGNIAHGAQGLALGAAGVAAGVGFTAGTFGLNKLPRALDERLDLTGRAATGAAYLAKVASYVPGVGGVAASVIPKLNKAMVYNKKRAKAEREERMQYFEYLTPAQKQVISGIVPSVLATKGQKMTKASMLKTMVSEQNLKLLKEDLQKKYVAQLRSENKNLSKADLEERADRLAKDEVYRRKNEMIRTAKIKSRAALDRDTEAEIDKLIKENPAAFVPLEASINPHPPEKQFLNFARKAFIEDPNGAASLSKEARMDMDFLVNGMLASQDGLLHMSSDGKTITGYDKVKMKYVIDRVGDKDMKDRLAAIDDFLEESPSGVKVDDIKRGVLKRDRRGNIAIYRIPPGKEKDKVMAAAQDAGADVEVLDQWFNENITNALRGIVTKRQASRSANVMDELKTFLSSNSSSAQLLAKKGKYLVTAEDYGQIIRDAFKNVGDGDAVDPAEVTQNLRYVSYIFREMQKMSEPDQDVILRELQENDGVEFAVKNLAKASEPIRRSLLEAFQATFNRFESLKGRAKQIKLEDPSKLPPNSPAQKKLLQEKAIVAIVDRLNLAAANELKGVEHKRLREFLNRSIPDRER